MNNRQQLGVLMVGVLVIGCRPGSSQLGSPAPNPHADRFAAVSEGKTEAEVEAVFGAAGVDVTPTRYRSYAKLKASYLMHAVAYHEGRVSRLGSFGLPLDGAIMVVRESGKPTRGMSFDDGMSELAVEAELGPGEDVEAPPGVRILRFTSRVPGLGEQFLAVMFRNGKVSAKQEVGE